MINVWRARWPWRVSVTKAFGHDRRNKSVLWLWLKVSRLKSIRAFNTLKFVAPIYQNTLLPPQCTLRTIFSEHRIHEKWWKRRLHATSLGVQEMTKHTTLFFTLPVNKKGTHEMYNPLRWILSLMGQKNCFLVSDIPISGLWDIEIDKITCSFYIFPQKPIFPGRFFFRFFSAHRKKPANTVSDTTNGPSNWEFVY